MKLKAILILSIFLTLKCYSQTSKEEYKEYCFIDNYQRGFCINYPTNILIPQKEVELHDGVTFLTKDKNNSVSIFRESNYLMEEEWDLEYFYKKDIKEDTKKTISYKRLGKGFYVISGINNEKVFYKKSTAINKELVTVVFRYVEKDKAIFNPIIEPITKSLKSISNE